VTPSNGLERARKVCCRRGASRFWSSGTRQMAENLAFFSIKIRPLASCQIELD